MYTGEQGKFTYEVRSSQLRSGDCVWLWEVRRDGRLVDSGADLQSAERAQEIALEAISYASGERRFGRACAPEITPDG